MKFVRAAARVVVAALAAMAAVVSPMLAGCSRAEQAPPVAYTLLDGRRSDLASLRGHVVLVNFWSTDCAPCIEEMPALVANWRRFAPQGFQTLAVAMQDDPPALVANFAQARALPFGVVIDNTGELAQRLGNVQFTPTSLLIDKRGRIVQRWIGKTDFEALAAAIASLQAETPGKTTGVWSALMRLVQALGMHLADGPNGAVGWLFALSDTRLAATLTAIHAAPARRWSLASLAQVAGMSRTSFAVHFEATVGESPVEYLTRWRMLRAGDRLENSDDSIAPIAQSLGYSSGAAFSSAFKRVMGCSPRRYGRRESAAKA